MPIPMAKGKPLPVRWQASGRPELARVEIDVEISHHGGFKGRITCDAADSGSLDVPATLVTKLIDLGWPVFRRWPSFAGRPATRSWPSGGSS
jgi:hypothetical protein